MPRLARPCFLVWSSLLASAGCASTTSAPCRTCDAGAPDQRVDRPLHPTTDSEAGQAGETAGDLPAAVDTAPDGPPPMRDTAAGEAPDPTPLLDAGYQLDDDFQTGRAPGWEIRLGDDPDASAGAWSVIIGTSGTILSQGVLDPGKWHIAYATAALASDQLVEARLRVVDFSAPGPASMAALFARYDPSTDSGYYLALRGDGSAVIRRRVRGVSASWGGGTLAGIRAGAWVTARLEVRGGVLNAFLDGVHVHAAVDDEPLSGGGVAVGSIGATLEVDRVSAAELPPP